MPNANTFFFSTDPANAVNVLLKVSGQRAAEFNDKEVQRHLADLDDKPTVFLVIGGSYPGQDNTPLQNHGIRCMTAGFKTGDDVQGEFSVMARDAAVVQEIRDGHMANIVNDVLKSILADNGTLAGPLAKAAPSVNQGTNTISVRARYPITDLVRFFQKQPPK